MRYIAIHHSYIYCILTQRKKLMLFCKNLLEFKKIDIFVLNFFHASRNIVVLFAIFIFRLLLVFAKHKSQPSYV